MTQQHTVPKDMLLVTLQAPQAEAPHCSMQLPKVALFIGAMP
jgi:hypothetical protein